MDRRLLIELCCERDGRVLRNCKGLKGGFLDVVSLLVDHSLDPIVCEVKCTQDYYTYAIFMQTADA